MVNESCEQQVCGVGVRQDRTASRALLAPAEHSGGAQRLSAINDGTRLALSQRY
jgi:hypothetical protein